MSKGPKDEETASLQASEFVSYVYVLPGLKFKLLCLLRCVSFVKGKKRKERETDEAGSIVLRSSSKKLKDTLHVIKENGLEVRTCTMTFHKYSSTFESCPGKKKWKKCCKFHPANIDLFVFVFVLSACAYLNRNSTCANTAHPHLFLFVIYRSRCLSNINARPWIICTHKKKIRHYVNRTKFL